MEDLLQHASGRDDALATEVESEINHYRHWAHCIAEMLVTLGRLQRLVHFPARDKRWTAAWFPSHRFRGHRRRTRYRDRFLGSREQGLDV